VLRARIILFAAKGWPNDDIVHQLSTNKMTVSKWRRRLLNWVWQDCKMPRAPAAPSASPQSNSIAY
jgi:hypothetical protein